jgi:hypothetical protein
VLGLAAGGGACSGLDTGNAEDPALIEVALAAGPGAPVDAEGRAFTLSSVVANVRHVDLYLPAGASCAGVPGLTSSGGDHSVSCEVDKIRARGPWHIDLLTGAATPALPPVPVVAGSYRRVDVRFEPDDVDSTTIVAEGTAPLAAMPTPYRLTLSFSEEARFEGTPVVAAPHVVAKAILRLDPSAWFDDLPLARCADDGSIPVTGGVLELEDADDECSDADDFIREAIKASGTLGDD